MGLVTDRVERRNKYAQKKPSPKQFLAHRIAQGAHEQECQDEVFTKVADFSDQCMNSLDIARRQLWKNVAEDRFKDARGIGRGKSIGGKDED